MNKLQDLVIVRCENVVYDKSKWNFSNDLPNPIVLTFLYCFHVHFQTFKISSKQKALFFDFLKAK